MQMYCHWKGNTSLHSKIYLAWHSSRSHWKYQILICIKNWFDTGLFRFVHVYVVMILKMSHDRKVFFRCIMTPFKRLTLTLTFNPNRFFFCLFLRMTMRVALAPQAAVSQTALRRWPSPAAFSRLPLVTQTCHQVSDGPGASKPLLPPCSENGNSVRNCLCGGGSKRSETVISTIYATGTCFISCTEKS